MSSAATIATLAFLPAFLELDGQRAGEGRHRWLAPSLELSSSHKVTWCFRLRHKSKATSSDVPCICGNIQPDFPYEVVL